MAKKAKKPQRANKPERVNKPEKKQRLDSLLVAQGLTPSRAQAQAAILAGQVYHGSVRLDKAGMQIAADSNLTLRRPAHPWVSRGGLKLEHGLDHFAIDVAASVCLDIGASTGGFTDVLLSRGAKRVYAVDVGWGQLDWRLRHDHRVVVLERVNARYLTDNHIPEAATLLVCDASFIGLRTILPPSMALIQPNGHLIALIKPQFEAGKNQIGKGGVVRDLSLHQTICATISDWLEECRWTVIGVTPSPIQGPAGNKEFLIAAQRRA